MAVLVAPGELWASAQNAGVSAGLGHHIVRSTMIGTPLVDEIVLETIAALKPAVLRSSEDAGFLYLLMPVRVS